MSALDLSLKYNPFYVYALNHKAYVYLLAYPAIAPDGLDKAEQILTESIALDPINFDARIGLARVLSKKGFPAKGLYVLEQGMQWRGARRFASIRYRNLMVELYHLLGRQDGIERMQAENAAYIRSMEYKMKTREGIDQWVDGKIKALLKQ